jgi:hypothetical protein
MLNRIIERTRVRRNKRSIVAVNAWLIELLVHSYFDFLKEVQHTQTNQYGKVKL